MDLEGPQMQGAMERGIGTMILNAYLIVALLTQGAIIVWWSTDILYLFELQELQYVTFGIALPAKKVVNTLARQMNENANSTRA